MTEDEAKTKWCPFVRFAGDAPGQSCVTANRYHAPDFPDAPIVSCIGSQCMAWRTENYIDDNRMPNVRGYCGLAGRP